MGAEHVAVEKARILEPGKNGIHSWGLMTLDKSPSLPETQCPYLSRNKIESNLCG